MVGRDNEAIAVARQCELLGLSRSSYYYSSTRDDEDDEYNLELMRLLDEQYTKVPFYGVRRLTAWLRARGYIVNPKRVRVLMGGWRFRLFLLIRGVVSYYPGLIRKGIFSQQCREATSGAGLPHALRDIFWTYSQQNIQRPSSPPAMERLSADRQASEIASSGLGVVGQVHSGFAYDI